MPRRSNQKLKLLYLSKILLEQTDEQRGITLSQIISELERYGIQCGRKCLYDDIEALRVFGIDVKTKRDRYVKYYVASKSFGRAERMLFTDAVISCRYISESKALELLRAISELNNSQLITQDVRETLSNKGSSVPNEEFYKSLDTILKAIAENKKLRFKCFEWNSQKQRKLMAGGEPFRVSPLKLVFNGEQYVLLAFDETKKSLERFLPERMLSATIVNSPREHVECFSEMSESDVLVDNVRIKCSNSMASEVLERFGLGISILANREEWFEFSTKTKLDASFFSWLFLNGDRVKLVAPEYAVKKLSDMCKSINESEL